MKDISQTDIRINEEKTINKAKFKSTLSNVLAVDSSHEIKEPIYNISKMKIAAK